MEEWSIKQWQTYASSADITAFYLYTPMCGTCAVASKMMDVVVELLPNVPIGMANINYTNNLAFDLEIESVPCLLITKDGKVTEKVYAFQSVTNLYAILKK
ncbi:thioredoxin family protein [Solibacillus sp. CAU 1738]|uniref:thioredoxin family protein n=1 Tax=Solibacillus sp. CAU 1738 TaxID=3140363 RepID=UPI0032618864